MTEHVLTIIGAVIAGMIIQTFVAWIKSKAKHKNKQDDLLSALQITVSEMALKIASVKKDTETSITQQREIIAVSRLLEGVKAESKYTKEKIDEITKRISMLEEKFLELKIKNRED